MADEPIALATYAAILADLATRRDQPVAAILASRGVTPEAFAAADAHHTEQLRACHRKRKGMLAMSFAAAFAEARRAAGLFGAPPPPPPEPAAPQAPAVPSYLASEERPAPPLPAPVVPPAALRVTAALAQPGPTAALPFQPGPVSEPPRPAPSAPTPSLGTGTALPAADAATRPDVPWTLAERRAGTRLTLAHFAALTVELWEHPPDLDAVLHRYGLAGPEDLRYVHAAFHAQMAADPALRAQFDSLVAQFRAMCRGGAQPAE